MAVQTTNSGVVRSNTSTESRQRMLGRLITEALSSCQSSHLFAGAQIYGANRVQAMVEEINSHLTQAYAHLCFERPSMVKVDQFRDLTVAEQTRYYNQCMSYEDTGLYKERIKATVGEVRRFNADLDGMVEQLQALRSRNASIIKAQDFEAFQRFAAQIGELIKAAGNASTPAQLRSVQGQVNNLAQNVNAEASRIRRDVDVRRQSSGTRQADRSQRDREIRNSMKGKGGGKG